MLFSSVTFLFYFLPIFLFVYYLAPNQLKNVALLVGSLFFYAWGEPRFVILMLVQIIIAYIFGIMIDKTRKNTNLNKLLLVSSIILSLASLLYFKYADFIISTINSIFNSNIDLLKVTLPIGISFYTFQILSYSVDVYRNDVRALYNPIDLATYIAMFPQLIAGPIVRLKDVEKDMNERTITLSMIAGGIQRFVIGLSKKVLVANVLGEVVDLFTKSNNYTVIATWTYCVCVSLQIYFDFSGYSDMAIGIGSMLGFSFPENFRYPFESKSVTEFWRRWHMTLGRWFRDYLYIPLGGNRVGGYRWIFNIAVVWAATGLWHGAAWNFVVWGLYFMLFLVAEKLFLEKYLDRSKVLNHIYLCLVVGISFIIFSADSMTDAGKVLSAMFGFNGTGVWDVQSLYNLKNYGTVILFSIIGATSIPRIIFGKINNKYVSIIGTILLFIISVAFLINGTYNPFLYFRF